MVMGQWSRNWICVDTLTKVKSQLILLVFALKAVAIKSTHRKWSRDALGSQVKQGWSIQEALNNEPE